MSEFDQSFPAAHIANELGIQLLTEDVPKLVAAMHRVYATGLRDGASSERRFCLQACYEVQEPAWYGYECPNTFDDGRNACAEAIRARGVREST